jgi:hypothetical protein
MFIQADTLIKILDIIMKPQKAPMLGLVDESPKN